jgi:lysophospholipase L1-like esterase
MPAGKPPGTSRIVFIGDSITFGYYVEEEEAFAQLVGKGLPSLLTTGCTFEVLNAGVSGLNSRQAFNHLTQRALYWSPDLVVWSFYLNDVLDSPGAEADILFPVRRLGLLSFLRFSALGRRLGNFIFSTRWGASLGIDPEEQANQLVEAGWRNAAEDLQRASAILAAKNIPLLVVVFPSAIQFGRSWTRPQYQARLKALCAKYKIGCIDLLPIFGQAGPASALYYYGDLIHPNAKGHFLAAEAILSFLKAHPAYLETLTKNCR